MYSIDPFYTVETLEIYTFIIPPSLIYSFPHPAKSILSTVCSNTNNFGY